MTVAVIIGDIVRSKTLAERSEFQDRLASTLRDVTRRSTGLASPFTITLGDEFQAVYTGADSLFADIFAILASIYPVYARFSISIGPLATKLNRKQALGMDGPVFHQAREGMNILKDEKNLFRIAGVRPDLTSLANHSLNLFSHQMVKWEKNRMQLMAGLVKGSTPLEIGRHLTISRPALYKNIHAGALNKATLLFKDLSQAVDAALKRS